ncbi:MAG: type II toxin-antitoxin system HicA family toxin [Campylobacteraceae bacterium]|nr:type II toxin-antitoxin system HicA family toxin [Campylobacteraceae bacterium]
MSKYDKLIEKMQNNPKDIAFKELKKILESAGFVGVNTGGSHWVFRKDGFQNITIPYKRPIKVIYVKKVLELLSKG